MFLESDAERSMGAVREFHGWHLAMGLPKTLLAIVQTQMHIAAQVDENTKRLDALEGRSNAA